MFGYGHGKALRAHQGRHLERTCRPCKAKEGKPGSIACLTTADAYDGFRGLVSEDFTNEVCARILLRGDKYRPVTHARKVRCPVLLQVCERDGLIPASAADKAEKELGGNAEVVRYPIGHFDIYVGDAFEKAVSGQLAFFRKHLRP